MTSLLLLAIAAPAVALPVPAASGSSEIGVATGRFLITQAEDPRPPGPADLREAIEIAQKQFGGQVAGSETVVRDGRTLHEVKLLGDDGTVRTVRIDPGTGAIIPQERDQA